jgi:hypothetical protein
MSNLTLVVGGRQSGKSTYIRENAPLNRMVIYPNIAMARHHFNATLERELSRVKRTGTSPFSLTYDNGQRTILTSAHATNVVGLIPFSIVGTDIRTVVIEDAEGFSNWILWKLRQDALKYNIDVWLTVTPEVIDTNIPPMWFEFAQKFRKPAKWVGLKPNTEMLSRILPSYPKHLYKAHLYGELIWK